MSKGTIYDLTELRERIKEDFENNPRGLSYYILIEHLLESGVKVPESPGRERYIGSVLSGMLGRRELVQTLVSEDVYEKWLGVKPKGGKVKGKYKIYILSQNQPTIDGLKRLQEIARTIAEAEIGISPLLRSKLGGENLFHILQEAYRDRRFLDVVVLAKLREFEDGLRQIEAGTKMKIEQIGADAERSIEETFADAVAQAHALYDETMKMLNEQAERAERIKGSIDKESSSRESSV